MKCRAKGSIDSGNVIQNKHLASHFHRFYRVFTTDNMDVNTHENITMRHQKWVQHSENINYCVFVEQLFDTIRNVINNKQQKCISNYSYLLLIKLD